MAVGRRLAEAVRQPVLLAGREVRLAASVGVAWGCPGQGEADALLRAADAALYRAKRAKEGRPGEDAGAPGVQPG